MSIFCDDESPPDFYSWREPVARKRHQCIECTATIEIGEKHFHATGKWDGTVSSQRQHVLCMEACMLVRDELEGECICFGALKEWYYEIRRESQYFQGEKKSAWRKLLRLMAKIRVRERKARMVMS